VGGGERPVGEKIKGKENTEKWPASRLSNSRTKEAAYSSKDRLEKLT